MSYYTRGWEAWKRKRYLVFGGLSFNAPDGSYFLSFHMSFVRIFFFALPDSFAFSDESSVIFHFARYRLTGASLQLTHLTHLTFMIDRYQAEPAGTPCLFFLSQALAIS